MKKLLSALPLWQNGGIAAIRIITGVFLLYHGWEVFYRTKINEYLTWDIYKNNPSALFMIYLGKGTEFITGFLLTFGIFTRITCLIVAVTFTYIAFFVGQGRIWYQDQHPFLFVLLALVFIFTGPGNLSVDQFIFKNKRHNSHKPGHELLD